MDVQKKKFCVGGIFLLMYAAYFICDFSFGLYHNTYYNSYTDYWTSMLVFVICPVFAGLAGILLLSRHTGIGLGIVFGFSALVTISPILVCGESVFQSICGAGQYIYSYEQLKAVAISSLVIEVFILLLLAVATFMPQKEKLKKINSLFAILPMLFLLFSLTIMNFEVWPALVCLAAGYMLGGFYILEPYPQTGQWKTVRIAGIVGLCILGAGIAILLIVILFSFIRWGYVYLYDSSTYFISSASFFMIAVGVMGALIYFSSLPFYKKEREEEKIDGEDGFDYGDQENENGYYPEIEEGYIDLAKHVLLCIFTFGIWQLIWIYRTTEYLNCAPNSEQYSPTSKLLLCIFIPFYLIFWFYRHGQRVDRLIKMKKGQDSDVATLCLVFAIFIPFVSYILMQSKINDIAEPQPDYEPMRGKKSGTGGYQANPGYYQASYIEQIMQLKGLLDSGIITQEEFDAKKKQLLGI